MAYCFSIRCARPFFDMSASKNKRATRAGKGNLSLVLKVVAALVVAGTFGSAAWYYLGRGDIVRDVADAADPAVESVVSLVERALASAGLGPGHIVEGEKEQIGENGKKWYLRKRTYRVSDKELMQVTLSLSELEETGKVQMDAKELVGGTALLVVLRVEDREAWRLRFVGNAREQIPPAGSNPPPDDDVILIAVIIDDIGGEWRRTPKLIGLDAELTFSVLPYSKYSERARVMLKEAGREVMLHIPMEPRRRRRRRLSIGHGGLLVGMSLKKIRRTVIDDINRVPEATGANNHMGSRFTAWKPGMKVVLEEMKKREMYFVDSRTGPHRKAYTLAKKMGVKCWARDVFLDNRNSVKYVRRQWWRFLRIAKKRGKAIAIGHPRKATYEVLRREIRRLGPGIKIVPASVIVEPAGRNGP